LHLTLGAAPVVLCFAISAPFLLSAVESDLEEQARNELAAAGITGVAVSFSGQDGSIACTLLLDDLEEVRALLEAERGVRVVEVADTWHAVAAPGRSEDEPVNFDATDDTTGGNVESDETTGDGDGDTAFSDDEAVGTSTEGSSIAPMSKPLGPYTPIVRTGDIIYVSGQGGLRDGVLVEGGVAAETEQAMANMAALLATEGCSLDDVVKTTVFLVDMDDYATLNEAYIAALGDHRPARSCVAVKQLPADFKVEIEAIAHKPA